MKDKVMLILLFLACINIVTSAAVFNQDEIFVNYKNRTDLKQIVSFQLMSTNAEMYQQEISIDYTKDKKADISEKPTLLQTSVSAIISTSIRSTLKNRDLLRRGFYYQLIKQVSKDVTSSLVMKSIFWLIPKKVKTVSQISLFILTNSYICYGKSLMKCMIHLFREIFKMIGYLILLSMIKKFSKNFVIKAIYFGFLSFLWDYLVRVATDNISDILTK